MLIYALKTAWKALRAIVCFLLAAAMLIGLICGVICLTDYSVFGTVVEEGGFITVKIARPSAFLWFDRLVNGGEPLDYVSLAYNGDRPLKTGDRVYALVVGATRLTPEHNSANTLFVWKIF